MSVTIETHLAPSSYLPALRADVLAGLRATPKTLPPKWFYDERGSALFEDITRRRIDPGLLQTTLGNNYELRVYPLNPGKSHTVVLTLVEAAPARLVLPLAYAASVPRFDLSLRYAGAPLQPQVESGNPLGLASALRKISAYAGIIAVPTAIAGIYGMNFRYMPELDWRYGYPLVLVLIVIICVVLYRSFKRSGWL